MWKLSGLLVVGFFSAAMPLTIAPAVAATQTAVYDFPLSISCTTSTACKPITIGEAHSGMSISTSPTFRITHSRERQTGVMEPFFFLPSALDLGQHSFASEIGSAANLGRTTGWVQCEWGECRTRPSDSLLSSQAILVSAGEFSASNFVNVRLGGNDDDDDNGRHIVPEPGSMALVLSGILALGGFLRRRSQRSDGTT